MLKELKCVDCGYKTIILFAESKRIPLCHECTLRRKLKDDENQPEEDSTSCEKYIFCPWCGDYYEPDLSDGLINDIVKCDNCGKKYSITSEVEVTFSTERAEDWD